LSLTTIKFKHTQKIPKFYMAKNWGLDNLDLWLQNQTRSSLSLHFGVLGLHHRI
jgi:hypothetical protein